MASDETDLPNVYAYRGRRLLSAYHVQHKEVPNHKLSQFKRVLKNPAATPALPVCIVGAGMAALYTAMILESLGISYHIVDAGTRERIGGRLFTYHFPNSGPYDYYDVGAMRFPDTPFMKRTFDLARNRGLNVNLIPYVMQMVDPPNTWLLFNNSRVNNHAPSVAGDPFDVSSYVADPDLRTPDGVSNRVSEVLQPFRNYFRHFPGLKTDIAVAMDRLFKETNKFSMRSYMFQNNMESKAISWCETLDKSTGWYDRALTETAIENLAFDWPTTPLPGPEQKKDPNVGWFCLDGGSSTLPQAMFASLPERAQKMALFESPVTAISRDAQKEVMRISINGVQSSQEYSAVISTIPLPRLSLVDLTGVNIHNNYAQWSAIRELQYGPSIKIGIKFSTPWWAETRQGFPLAIHGGQSYTDLPIRTIVYPSYPKVSKEKPEETSKVLIVSYCWTQDAERLGALMNGDGTARPELITMVFQDLAAVHGVTVEWLKQFYTDGDYFAWDWNHDPLTMGAFAFFGPGVYDSTDVYSEITQPAARGKLFFAGEATSACHAWVAGALDSAWRAVDQYLALNQAESVRDKFWKLWGPTEYWNEASNKGLVDFSHQLTERHLVIGLCNSGVIPWEE